MFFELSKEKQLEIIRSNVPEYNTESILQKVVLFSEWRAECGFWHENGDANICRWHMESFPPKGFNTENDFIFCIEAIHGKEYARKIRYTFGTPRLIEIEE